MANDQYKNEKVKDASRLNKGLNIDRFELELASEVERLLFPKLADLHMALHRGQIPHDRCTWR